MQPGRLFGSQPDLLLGHAHGAGAAGQPFGARDARPLQLGGSPMVSQGLSQRSAAGIGTLAGPGPQRNSLLLSQQLSQPLLGSQDGFGTRPLSSGAGSFCPSPSQPALSGVFRPGSAPSQRQTPHSQLSLLPGGTTHSPWQQQQQQQQQSMSQGPGRPADAQPPGFQGLQLGGRTGSASHPSLLQHKPLSSGRSALSNLTLARPGSAPVLQQQQQQQQTSGSIRGPSALVKGATSGGLLGGTNLGARGLGAGLSGGAGSRLGGPGKGSSSSFYTLPGRAQPLLLPESQPDDPLVLLQSSQHHQQQRRGVSLLAAHPPPHGCTPDSSLPAAMQGLALPETLGSQDVGTGGLSLDGTQLTAAAAASDANRLSQLLRFDADDFQPPPSQPPPPPQPQQQPAEQQHEDGQQQPQHTPATCAASIPPGSTQGMPLSVGQSQPAGRTAGTSYAAAAPHSHNEQRCGSAQAPPAQEPSGTPRAASKLLAAPALGAGQAAAEALAATPVPCTAGGGAAAAAAAGGPSPARQELLGRISTLEQHCSSMSAIVTRDIPLLLQHQADSHQQLLELAAAAGSSTSAAGCGGDEDKAGGSTALKLKAQLQQLSDSVSSFMQEFRQWQQAQQPAEQQHALILSHAACQTTPGLGGSTGPTPALQAACGRASCAPPSPAAHQAGQALAPLASQPRAPLPAAQQHAGGATAGVRAAGAASGSAKPPSLMDLLFPPSPAAPASAALAALAPPAAMAAWSPNTAGGTTEEQAVTSPAGTRCRGRIWPGEDGHQGKDPAQPAVAAEGAGLPTATAAAAAAATQEASSSGAGRTTSQGAAAASARHGKAAQGGRTARGGRRGGGAGDKADGGRAGNRGTAAPGGLVQSKLQFQRTTRASAAAAAAAANAAAGGLSTAGGGARPARAAPRSPTSSNTTGSTQHLGNGPRPPAAATPSEGPAAGTAAHGRPSMAGAGGGGSNSSSRACKPPAASSRMPVSGALHKPAAIAAQHATAAAGTHAAACRGPTRDAVGVLGKAAASVGLPRPGRALACPAATTTPTMMAAPAAATAVLQAGAAATQQAAASQGGSGEACPGAVHSRPAAAQLAVPLQGLGKRSRQPLRCPQGLLGAAASSGGLQPTAQHAGAAAAAAAAPSCAAGGSALLLFGDVDIDDGGEDDSVEDAGTGGGEVCWPGTENAGPPPAVPAGGRAPASAAGRSPMALQVIPPPSGSRGQLQHLHLGASQQRQQQQLGSSQQQQQQQQHLVDDEELARQVAAHMARHRSKRRRTVLSRQGGGQLASGGGGTGGGCV